MPIPTAVATHHKNTQGHMSALEKEQLPAIHIVTVCKYASFIHS